MRAFCWFVCFRTSLKVWSHPFGSNNLHKHDFNQCFFLPCTAIHRLKNPTEFHFAQIGKASSFVVFFLSPGSTGLLTDQADSYPSLFYFYHFPGFWLLPLLHLMARLGHPRAECFEATLQKVLSLQKALPPTLKCSQSLGWTLAGAKITIFSTKRHNCHF